MTLPRDPEAVRVLAEKLAREHVAGGGKVVGYVTPCVPAELVEASGMLPVMLAGGGETSTALGDRYMEDLFDTGVRAVFERLLKGEFDFLSAIVLPRANDFAHRLYYYLSELERTAAAKLPHVLLADVAMTPDAASRTYSVGALERLWLELQEIGSKRGAAGLRMAVKASNRRMELLDEFIDRRRAFPGAMTGSEALAGFAAARMLPGAVFEDAMAALLRRGAVAHPGPPVMVCGSAHEGAELHALVESAGGVVVGDFHAAGELSVGALIDETKPPLEAIVDRDRGSLAATRSFADPAAEVVSFAQACGAEAVVFSYFAEEEALTWDYPEQKRALEAISVRVVRLKDQARPFDAETDRATVEAFVRGAG